MPKAISHRDVGKALGEIKGFDEGRELQRKIMDLGDRFRQLRKEVLGITQTEAAKIIGMEQPELSRIENGFGNRGPSYMTIARIIDAYQAYLADNMRNVQVGLTIQVSEDNDGQANRSFLAGGG